MALPIWQRTIVTEAGDVVPGAEVEVINEATGVAATIFSDRNGAVALSNPFFADSSGFAKFYAAPGEYRITATGVSGTITWRYALVGGKAELSSYDNTVSGATATNVQAGLDEAFSTMVKLTGNQTIAGVKTFSASPIVPNATLSGQPVALGQFTQSLTPTGWQKLPSGLIEQWGETTFLLSNGYGTQSVSFPIVFPNACFGVDTTVISVDGKETGITPIEMFTKPSVITNASFTYIASHIKNYGSSGVFKWRAIGY